jgi:glyoxylase-like metal-dependent hydrolase (beta-lactamase superfamily II)
LRRSAEVEMADIRTLDLEFYGTSELISSFLVPADGGFALIDPGPASAVDVVERQVEHEGFSMTDLDAIFATHVHLDHSGGAGVLAQRTGCAVYCHPVGAPHLIDPAAKLLPSAERLYGEMMEPLWGKTVGVPQGQLVTVADGETVTIGDVDVVGWHTPGHASHHVAWQIGDALATGDVAGVRIPGATHVRPPMPPPDIDIQLWKASVDILRGLEPSRLLLTHFGAFDDAVRHLDELQGRIERWAEVARKVVTTGGGRDELGEELERMESEEISELGLSEDVVSRYQLVCPVKESSTGLHRYWSLQD